MLEPFSNSTQKSITTNLGYFYNSVIRIIIIMLLFVFSLVGLLSGNSYLSGEDAINTIEMNNRSKEEF